VGCQTGFSRWQRGVALAWQVFDRDGKLTAEKGTAEGVPV
jgi:hypothetical protein